MIGGKTAYIGLGSNMGDRRANIEHALRMMDNSVGIEVKKVSTLIETEPVGGPKQGRYLNGAAAVATSLEPDELLKRLQDIETQLGRTRQIRWGPRTIDLDILLYGETIITKENLKIPHPELHKRDFVLVPLREIAPEAQHPVLGKCVSELTRIFHKPTAKFNINDCYV